MLSLNKPSLETVQQFINRQQQLPVSYRDVGITQEGVCPPGFGTDRVKEILGSGSNTFSRAVTAFEKWEEFDVNWVEVYPRNAPIVRNSVVSVLAWHGGFWSLNACRIIYIIDEHGPVSRFGFGYGTLPDHSETGEERFLLQWDQGTDLVTYEILAFSNPNHLLGWLAYPLVRHIQNHFRRDSARLLKQKLSSANTL